MIIRKFEYELTFMNAALDTVANAIKSAKTFMHAWSISNRIGLI